MTNKEAIKKIKEQQNEFNEHCIDYAGINKAYNMAIKALEQEPCEDCVSRGKALNVVHKYFEHYLHLNDDICLDGLRSLPSVTPTKEKTGHWVQQPRYEGDEQPDLVCPNCGFKISWWDMGNFCAKCGTGLEGGAG